VVFPEIISLLPGPSGLYGVLFFGSLVLAGISSLISITQTYVSAMQEKFLLSRRSAVALAGGGTALVSLVYATGGGINTLDVVDRFINGFGVAAVGAGRGGRRRVGPVVEHRPGGGHAGRAGLDDDRQPAHGVRGALRRLRDRLPRRRRLGCRAVSVRGRSAAGVGTLAVAGVAGAVAGGGRAGATTPSAPPSPPGRRSEDPMSTAAITTMVVGMIAIWGGLTISVLLTMRRSRRGAPPRDRRR
jgi:hypothetical protein